MAYKIVTKRFSDPRVRRSLFRVLRENVLCSMATVTKTNRAHVNTAFFCYSPDLELYFLSAPFSLHCQNLATNPSMAMTIFSSAQRWDEPGRGIQLFGTCREARGRDAEKAERLYGARFPAYARWMGSRDPEQNRAAAQLQTYRFYRFLPRKVKILDEQELGGAVFVVASVGRRRRAS